MVKPFNDGVKAINARFKTMTDPLSLAERHVKGEIAGYQAKRQEDLDRAARAEQNRLRDEARAKADAEREAGNFIQAEMMSKDIKAITVDAVRVGHGKETGASSSITKVWKFEVIEELAAASARPDLMQVDAVKVRAAIKVGVRDVPGLRIYEEAVVAIR